MTLWDPPDPPSDLPGAAERDAGIVAAAIGADPEWARAALHAVAWVAERRERFTTDAVWGVLERFQVYPPREPRAMGPVIKRAQAEGWIDPTDEFRPSVRPVCHRQPIRVWRSSLYRPA